MPVAVTYRHIVWPTWVMKLHNCEAVGVLLYPIGRTGGSLGGMWGTARRPRGDGGGPARSTTSRVCDGARSEGILPQ